MWLPGWTSVSKGYTYTYTRKGPGPVELPIIAGGDGGIYEDN